MCSIIEKKDESLRDFVERFRIQYQATDHPDDSTAVLAFMSCIRSGDFYMDLHATPPETMTELWLRAEKWVDKTEASEAKRAREMEPE